MARALLISLAMGLSGAPAAAAVEPLPRSFMWGVAGSAWQTEGGAVADNWHHYASVRPTFEPVPVRFRGSCLAATRGDG